MLPSVSVEERRVWVVVYTCSPRLGSRSSLEHRNVLPRKKRMYWDSAESKFDDCSKAVEKECGTDPSNACGGDGYQKIIVDNWAIYHVLLG